MTSNALFVIGYMACGKTTFGRALARTTGREFIDLDFRIEQRFRKSISQIFADSGEEYFRKIESGMLSEVAEMENVVVACGGGTPCFNRNMDLMLENGTVIWLEASPERMVERLIINRSRRPLMADKTPGELLDAVKEGLAARTPHYSRANIRFNGDLLETRDQIAATIAEFLRIHESLFK